jgi:hypothetical protein
MTRRAKLWLAIASLFSLINAGGGGFAAALSQWNHAGVHAVLLLLGMYAGWRLLPRAAAAPASDARLAGDRLEQIQQSVDAVAVEVERIGEAQRFSAKLQQERVETGR